MKLELGCFALNVEHFDRVNRIDLSNIHEAFWNSCIGVILKNVSSLLWKTKPMYSPGDDIICYAISYGECEFIVSSYLSDSCASGLSDYLNRQSREKPVVDSYRIGSIDFCTWKSEGDGWFEILTWASSNGWLVSIGVNVNIDHKDAAELCHSCILDSITIS